MAMSATDANRFVLRFARHLTGRPRIAVMDWCYHGTVDETLAVLDGDRVVPRPGALGPQVDVAVTTAVVPFNDLEALDRRLAEGDVACLLMEPALTNIGIVLPEDGYLAGVREITRRHGVLLVIDETHTMCAGPAAHRRLGPRARLRGDGQADRRRGAGGGVRHDAEVADRLSGPMLGHEIDVAGVGGTLTGNALAMAAVRATLRPPAPGGLRRRGPARATLHRRHPGGHRRARPALARAAARLPRGVLVLPPPRAGAEAPRPWTRTSRASCTCGASTAACC